MRNHKTLIAWQRARAVTVAVFRLGAVHGPRPSPTIWWQLERAALSVQLNIAEGFALWTTPQQLRHYRIAYGSAVEAAELLEMLVDEGAGNGDCYRPILADNARCRAALTGLIKRLSCR